MTSLFDLATLICASFGAMVLGIFAAFGALRLCFALIRPQRSQARVKPQAEAARVSESLP